MKNFTTAIVIAASFLGQQFVIAQVKDSATVGKDTAKVTPAKPGEKPDAKKTGPKPFKEIITAKAISDDGVFNVHKVEDKYFFEIPDAMLTKEFLLVTRLTKSAAGMRTGTTGYAGDQIGQSVITFEKGPKDKI